MVNVSLSIEERDTLLKAMEIYLAELRMEIVDTDSSRQKGRLNRERTLLESVVDAIRTGVQNVVR